MEAITMSRPHRTPGPQQRGLSQTARVVLIATLGGLAAGVATSPALAQPPTIAAKEPGDIFDWWDKEKKPGLDDWLKDGGKELVGDTPLTPDMGKKPDNKPADPKKPEKPDPGNADPKKPIPPPEKPDAGKKPGNPPDLGLGGLFNGLLNTVISLIGGLFGIGR